MNCPVTAENDSWARMEASNITDVPAGLSIEQQEASRDGDAIVISGWPGICVRRFKIDNCGLKADGVVHCSLYKDRAVVQFKAHIHLHALRGHRQGPNKSTYFEPGHYQLLPLGQNHHHPLDPDAPHLQRHLHPIATNNAAEYTGLTINWPFSSSGHGCGA